MNTIEQYIQQGASQHPDKVAIVCGQQRCTYRELQLRIDSREAELREAGYLKGQIVARRALPSINYLVDYFALHQVGCVVTPLERSLPDASYEMLAHELEAMTVPEGSADILYTTGTTGQRKGVIISHATILADADNLIEGQGFTPELAFVVNGPLNHIGSLSKVYPVLMVGATLIIVDGMKDMNLFFDAFNYPAPKTATFLVPASIRMLLLLAADRLAALAHKMDFIETGAAAIAKTDMLRLCQLLPDTRLYNTYASTETGIISTYNFNDGLCVADCLGKPMRNSHVLITDEGRIACRGKTLMTGYVGAPELTATVLRDGTLYTADLGMIDAEGMLHLKGRADDVINVGGFNVAPTEVEDAALAHPDVEDCVCIAVDHNVTGQALKLLVVMKDEKTLNTRELARYLKGKLETHKIPLLYSQTERIARTFNGKTDRKYYRRLTGEDTQKDR